MTDEDLSEVGLETDSVTEISCYRVTIDSPGGQYAMSGGRRYDSFESTIVQVTMASGAYGLGEASTLGGDYLEGFRASVEATIQKLGAQVFGSDVLRPHVLSRAMDAALIGHFPGKAALDAALWDVRGKLLGRPVADLLGGSTGTSFPAWTGIRIGDTATAVQEALALADLGYTRLQVKVGDNPKVDAERTQSIIDAFGGRGEYLACDANRGWTTAEAVDFASRLDDPTVYLEQPCPSLAELAQVSSRTPNPIVIDEGARTPRDLLDAIAKGCVDAVNIKPVRVGGLTKAAVMRDIAQAARLRILVDEPMGGPIATAGIASFAATVDPSLLIAGAWFGDHEYAASHGPVPSRGPGFSDGCVVLQASTGLGADLDVSAFGEPAFQLRRRDTLRS